MAHIYSHCSLYSVHCCCPNTSHAKSSTHTEPLLSRWSFSSAQTTYEPHIENSVLLVPSRRERMFSLHHIYILSLLLGLEVSLTSSEPSKICEHVGVYECIRYETMGRQWYFLIVLLADMTKGSMSGQSQPQTSHPWTAHSPFADHLMRDARKNGKLCLKSTVQI